MLEEIWKDINGYEGLYQVSNFGRVKSLARIRKTRKDSNGKQGSYQYKGCILKQKNRKTNVKSLEYYQVTLSKNGTQKMFSPHRLVAEAFIPNPNNKPYVNHIDGNGKNNNVDNLEWTTNRENQNHAVRIMQHSHNKPIIAFDKRTKCKMLEFEIMGDAADWLINNNRTIDDTCLTGIIKCCKRKIPSYLGFVWRYREEVVNGAYTD